MKQNDLHTTVRPVIEVDKKRLAELKAQRDAIEAEIDNLSNGGYPIGTVISVFPRSVPKTCYAYMRVEAVEPYCWEITGEDDYRCWSEIVARCSDSDTYVYLPREGASSETTCQQELTGLP